MEITYFQYQNDRAQMSVTTQAYSNGTAPIPEQVTWLKDVQNKHLSSVLQKEFGSGLKIVLITWKRLSMKLLLSSNVDILLYLSYFISVSALLIIFMTEIHVTTIVKNKSSMQKTCWLLRNCDEQDCLSQMTFPLQWTNMHFIQWQWTGVILTMWTILLRLKLGNTITSSHAWLLHICIPNEKCSWSTHRRFLCI